MGRQELMPKKLESSAGWIPYPAVKEEDLQSLSRMPVFWTTTRQGLVLKKLPSSAARMLHSAVNEKVSWTAGRHDLEQKTLLSYARWIPYPETKAGKSWSRRSSEAALNGYPTLRLKRCILDNA